MSDMIRCAAWRIACRSSDTAVTTWWLNDVKRWAGLYTWERSLEAFAYAASKYGIYYIPNTLAGCVVTATQPIRPALMGGYEIVPAESRNHYSKESCNDQKE